MKTIRVEKFRCLADTGDIQIKPLTVVVGQNSSGKSTFLRAFPLLKQSIESRTTGPILWNGRLVDFGSYEDAHQNDAEDGIRLSFRLNLGGDDPRYFYYVENAYSLIHARSSLVDNPSVYISMQLTEDKKKERTRIDELVLLLEDSKIHLKFSEDDSVIKFQVNDLDVLKLGGKYIARKIGNSSLLPIIAESSPKRDIESDIARVSASIVSPRYASSQTLLEKLIEYTKKLNHPRSKTETIVRMSLSFAAGSSEAMLKDMQNNKYSNDTWKKKTSSWNEINQQFQELRNLVIANMVPFIIEKCDDMLSVFSKQISYIGPVRATAERYYRTQDLAVDEVDYQGQNLAMFLRNLTDAEMQNFSDWTSKNLGFKARLQPSLGHLSIKIKPNDSKKEFNVADTGFGFSQILPIITQLWLLSARRRTTRQNRLGTTTFAIEQPELHLHPRLQGRLADTFVEALRIAKNKTIDLNLVIETHSEALINRLGYLVSEGKILPEDINIVIFDFSEDTGTTTTKISTFNRDGYLSGWPIGFFDLDFQS
jgi:predicted ATPase